MKRIVGLLLILTVILTASYACAKTFREDNAAIEITDLCSFDLAGSKNAKNLTDRKFTTHMESKKTANPALTVNCKQKIYGLYLCFDVMPQGYEVQIADGKNWTTVYTGDPEIYHIFIDVKGSEKVRVIGTGDKKQVMGFNEVSVFGEGEAPDWVQRWEPIPEKADILFVVTHPEEEILYLGGSIPYYSCEKEKSVAVACFSYGNTTRRSELLNGLWSMGYRYYPIIGNFKTANAKSAVAAYKGVDGKNGEKLVQAWLADVIRRVRPEVIVGPDPEGEGNNGQRMMVADACHKCFSLAADDGSFVESAAKYGSWQAQKLYLHLYGSQADQVDFDWDIPMENHGGKNGTQMAIQAYQYHKTQIDAKNSTKAVLYTGVKYDNSRFGLVETMVGPDTNHDDFLENIPESRLAEHEEPAPLRSWSIDEILPELNEKGFLDGEEEYVYSDDAHGHYVYISSSLKVIIERKHDGALPLTWYESEIWCDPEAGELMQNIEFTPDKPVGKKSRVNAAKNALEHQVVFAVNSDYYTYRVGAKNHQPIGIEIRDGQIYFDEAYEPGDPDESKFFPNKDTLAFYPDGNADVHHSSEMSAQEYLDKGAYMVFSFGPYLLKDGKLSEWVTTNANKSFSTKNPRHCFGIIEPGHYMDITCEGRLGARSEGVTTTQIAAMAQGLGCRDVLNLDGGQTEILVFMGQQLNQINKVNGSDNVRETCEILCIGTSEQVGTFSVK